MMITRIVGSAVAGTLDLNPSINNKGRTSTTVHRGVIGSAKPFKQSEQSDMSYYPVIICRRNGEELE